MQKIAYIFDSFYFQCPREYCIRGDVVRVAVGDILEQTKSVEARIIFRVTCRAGNVVEELGIVEYKKLEAFQAPKSELLRKMGLRTGARRRKISETNDLRLEDYLSATCNTPESGLTYWL